MLSKYVDLQDQQPALSRLLLLLTLTRSITTTAAQKPLHPLSQTKWASFVTTLNPNWKTCCVMTYCLDTSLILMWMQVIALVSFIVKTTYLINEVNSGSWYNIAYNNLIKDPSTEFLMPIIIFVDKTGTDKIQWHSVEPILFTMSTIAWACRQQTHAWRALGYIPDLYSKTNASKAATQKKNNQARGQGHWHYHSCLCWVLQSFIYAQQRSIVFDFQLGNQVKRVLIQVPLAFVMGDGKSADMLTGRYGSYNMGWESHACNCLFDNLCNTKETCHYLLHSNIQKLQQQAMADVMEANMPPNEAKA